MQQNSIALVGIELSPGLVSYVELGQDSAPVEQHGLLADEVLMVAGGVGGLGTQQRAFLQGCGAVFEGVKARKGERRVRRVSDLDIRFHGVGGLDVVARLVVKVS